MTDGMSEALKHMKPFYNISFINKIHEILDKYPDEMIDLRSCGDKKPKALMTLDIKEFEKLIEFLYKFNNDSVMIQVGFRGCYDVMSEKIYITKFTLYNYEADIDDWENP